MYQTDGERSSKRANTTTADDGMFKTFLVKGGLVNKFLADLSLKDAYPKQTLGDALKIWYVFVDSEFDLMEEASEASPQSSLI